MQGADGRYFKGKCFEMSRRLGTLQEADSGEPFEVGPHPVLKITSENKIALESAFREFLNGLSSKLGLNFIHSFRRTLIKYLTVDARGNAATIEESIY